MYSVIFIPFTLQSAVRITPHPLRGGGGGGGVRGEKTQGEREEIKEKRGGRDVGMNQNSC